MPGLGGGFAPINIPLVTPGAMPSAMSGVAGTSDIAELLQAVGQFPAQKATADAQRVQRTQQERQLAQQEYDATVAQIKGNPTLARSPVYVQKLKELSKRLGIPAPIVPDGGPTAGTSSGSGAAGASVPGGPGAPSAPMQQPFSADAKPQAPWNPPMAAPSDASLSGRASGIGLTPQSAPSQADVSNVTLRDPPQAQRASSGGGEMVDYNALVPQQTFADFAKNPASLKEAYSLTPEQRRSAYGHLPGAPEAFFTARKTWGPEETQKMIYARQMFQSFGRGQMDAKTAIGALKSVMPMFQNDPNFDLSSLIDPQTFAQIGAAEASKIRLLEQSGLYKKSDLARKWAATQGQLDMLRSREGVNAAMVTNLDARTGLAGAQAGLASARTAVVGPEAMARIANISSEITNRASQAQNRAAQLKLAVQKADMTALHQAKGEANQSRGQLVQTVARLQSAFDDLKKNGMDDQPDPDPNAVDAQGNHKSLGVTLSERKIAADAALKALDDGMREANSPQAVRAAVQKSLGGSTRKVTDVSDPKNGTKTRTGRKAESPGKPTLYENTDGSWTE